MSGFLFLAELLLWGPGLRLLLSRSPGNGALLRLKRLLLLVIVVIYVRYVINGSRPTHYDILELSPSATKNEIQSAYRRLSLRFHPDRNSDSAAAVHFQKLTVAMEVLTHPEKRQRYHHFGNHEANIGIAHSLVAVLIRAIMTMAFGVITTRRIQCSAAKQAFFGITVILLCAELLLRHSPFNEYNYSSFYLLPFQLVYLTRRLLVLSPRIAVTLSMDYASNHLQLKRNIQFVTYQTFTLVITALQSLRRRQQTPQGRFTFVSNDDDQLSSPTRGTAPPLLKHYASDIAKKEDYSSSDDEDDSDYAPPDASRSSSDSSSNNRLFTAEGGESSSGELPGQPISDTSYEQVIRKSDQELTPNSSPSEELQIDNKSEELEIHNESISDSEAISNTPIKVTQIKETSSISGSAMRTSSFPLERVQGDLDGDIIMASPHTTAAGAVPKSVGFSFIPKSSNNSKTLDDLLRETFLPLPEGTETVLNPKLIFNDEGDKLIEEARGIAMQMLAPPSLLSRSLDWLQLIIILYDVVGL